MARQSLSFSGAATCADISTVCARQLAMYANMINHQHTLLLRYSVMFSRILRVLPTELASSQFGTSYCTADASACRMVSDTNSNPDVHDETPEELAARLAAEAEAARVAAEQQARSETAAAASDRGRVLRSGRVIQTGNGQAGTHSVAAASGSELTGSFLTVDTLAEALRRSQHSGPPDITKGKLPEWNFKTEDFVAFEQKVLLWVRRHNIENLLEHPPALYEEAQHRQAKSVILSTLPAADRTSVFNIENLCDAWSYLVSKYLPSRDAEINSLYAKFNDLQQGNRGVQDYLSEVMSVYTRLRALGVNVDDRWVTLKLLNVGPEFNHLRDGLMTKSPDEIVAALCEYSRFLSQQRAALARTQPAGGGPGHGNRNQRRGGGGGNQRPPPAVGAVGAQQQQQQQQQQQPDNRVCHHCKKKGHIKRDCPQLPAEVRKYLLEEFQKRMKGKNAVCALQLDFAVL